MTPEKLIGRAAKRSVETPARLNSNDLDELCDAADEAILSGGGFGWLSPPPRSVMEDYWRGVQMIPERHLVVARLDKVMILDIQNHAEHVPMPSARDVGSVA